MKILMTTSTFPRWAGDSQAPFILLLGKHLAELGHEIHILAPHAQGAKKYEVMEGVSVHRYGYFWPHSWQKLCYGAGIVPNMKRSLLAKIQVPFFLTAQAGAIVSMNAKIRPDIIHAHWLLPQGLVGAMVNLLMKKPFIISVHGSDVFLFRKNAMTPLLSSAAMQADRVIANSSAAQVVLAEDYSAKNAQVIPMGVSISSFDAVNRETHLPTVLFVGRLIDVKGAEYLVRAVPTIVASEPDVRVVLAGDGPEKQRLEELAKSLKVSENIEFLGAVPSDQMPKLLKESDIFVGPAITTDKGQVEAFGVAFLEAMASELAVITTGTGGIKDIVVPDETAVIVSEKDDKAISKAVITLLNDAPLRKRLGKAGRERVEKYFTWQKVASQYDQVYQEIGRSK
jgi:glycosyltransferase involved in cell wall biosynthesis